MAAALTQEQLGLLKDASRKFLSEKHYGAIEVEVVMVSVFGAYTESRRRDSPIASEWDRYWTALAVYHEANKEYLSKALKEGVTAPVQPAMPGIEDDIPATPTTGSGVILKVKLGSAKPPKRKGPETVADDEPPTKKKPGPRANSLLDRLSSADVDNNKSTANKSYWTCIADGCSHRRAGRRTAAEVLTHALRCDFLRKQYPVARKEAEDEHARNALGAEKAADPQTSSQDQPRPVGRPRNLETDEKGQGKLDQSSFRDAGRKKSKEEQETWQRKADHLLMLLICKSGLIPHLLDKEDWAAFVTHLNPSYVVTGSKKFLNEYIPQEAALVKQKTKAALQDSRDLTYTSDGTSIRRGDQFYTAHACTPSRDVYFLGGQFGTKDSHNAEWIKNGAIAKMQEIGLELWASMVTDSTNVTLAARRGVTKEAPTILDLCDVIHFLQHIIGDINELPEYESMMEALKPLLRHFSKSGKSKDFLRDSGEGMADDGGKLPVKMLAKVGKTRFATHYMSVNTVSPAARNIQSLVLAGKIKFRSALLQEIFGDPTSLKLPTFLRDMLSYQMVVESLARSLWSLEGTTANASDAFSFWYSIANSLDSRFQTDSGISKELAGHVRAIFNKRYHQFFGHSDAYFVAFCLDPRFPNAEYLRPRPEEARPKGVPEHILYPHAFFRVKEFLKKVLRPLVELHETHDTTCRCHPVLKIPDFDFSETLKLQLEAFWLGEPPFHAPVIGGDTMEWWTNLAIGNSPRSNVIAMLAVRIFGILVNSMPDERTNSTITWFNSPLRGNQQQEGLLDMIMVGQWHKYHAPGAKGPRRTPRRPTVAFRRLDKKMIEKTKMKMREQASDSEASDSDADSEEITEQDQAELQKLTDTLRAKIAGGVFVVDPDVMLDAPGFLNLLSDADDTEDVVEEAVSQSQPVASSSRTKNNWTSCGIVSEPYLSSLVDWSKEHITAVFQAPSNELTLLALDSAFSRSLQATVNGEPVDFEGFAKMIGAMAEETAATGPHVDWAFAEATENDDSGRNGVVKGEYYIRGICGRIPGSDGRLLEIECRKEVVGR
ncbi:ribonuclease H-like domain-containing protein [Favolaschia claudopus]|uniref:Ribonuclease H-like domain-containing protein n=1 Tax=Favolaschia claudopus TaxID=2862362 RepID=A0AAV9ZFZ2_9AGAR